MQQLEINPVKLKEYIMYLEEQIALYISVEDVVHLKSILRIPKDTFFYTGIAGENKNVTANEEQDYAEKIREQQEKHKQLITKLSEKLFVETDENDLKITKCKRKLYESICINGTKDFNAQLDQIIGNYLTDNLIQIVESIPKIIDHSATTLAEINKIPQSLEFCLRELSKTRTSNNAIKNSFKEGYEALRGIF